VKTLDCGGCGHPYEVADDVVSLHCGFCDYKWMLDLERKLKDGTLSEAGKAQLVNVRKRRQAAPELTPAEINELFAQRRENHEWKRATGFEAPEALGLYLSRLTVQEDAAMHGRVLAEAFSKSTTLETRLAAARATAMAEAKEAVAQALMESSWAATSNAGADIGPSIETCRVHPLCLAIDRIAPHPQGYVISHEEMKEVRTALARVQMFGGLPGAEAMFVADALTALERLDHE